MRVSIERLAFAYGAGAGAFRLQVPVLEAPSGTSLAIVGPSGAGKTTLLHLVAGILEPDAGVIRLGDSSRAPGAPDVNLMELGEAARRAFRLKHIGAVFQTFALLEYLTVEENILLPYRLSRTMKRDADAVRRARALAADVRLGDKLTRRPAELSQGERQRVAICRAVVTQPRIVLADEPTGNLDVRTKNAVVEVLLEQVRAMGATLLTVTHDKALVPRFDAVYEVASSPARAGSRSA